MCGTGSATAILLARLGVGQIALLDNDIVDRTNLNRLHGSRQVDADAMRPKVGVVARTISEMGLGVRLVPIKSWVGDPVCRDTLCTCDIVFGCTDDHEGRLFLNRFAYFYLVPVIDIVSQLILQMETHSNLSRWKEGSAYYSLTILVCCVVA